MGRHSRRDRQNRAADRSDVPPGAVGPPPTAGPGRRRQGTAGPPAGGDEVRGGHPEQREPGGGWGAFPGSAGPGTRTAGAPRIPGPRAAEPETSMFGTPLAAPGSGPGPRPEYLAAFAGGGSPRFPDGADGGDGADGADDDVFRAGAPGVRPYGPDGGGAGDGLPPGGRFTGRSVVFDRERIAELDRREERAAEGAETGGPDGPDDPDAAAGSRSGGAGKGAKGRTFTGAAAAAVTTVLAVVIAGQVADQHPQGDDGRSHSGDDRADGGTEASRSQTRTGQDAKPAGYAAQMARVFPLDPQLTASGHFTPVGGDARAPGRGKVLRYRVDVEDGLPLDGALFAEAVHKTLNDDRSWAHGGQRTFQRVASGDADFVISLASPGTTAKWCAKSGLDTTEDNVSCDSAATDRVMINAYRWAQGAKTYGPDKMLAYRQMLINHEVGHRLGHNHEVCPRQGALAPVMMQQTKFLTTDGVTCRPNSWPYPTGR
ncbi:DUF3152 domain-containing protein [Streptomyces sp. GS7]|uniref:DUF3152 domain-containing protein n=1 Tax=Streptomyces sp. GS7 TaxID=2692234 RepID=UPI001F3F78B4|nr:DUF3152 domain-containing protein [Streptomyces sp. GS7]